ncbi:MAG: type II secretion system F family protein [Pseudomonadota bacterium]
MSTPGPTRRFRYIARDAQGRRSTASLSAVDKTAAVAELRRRGLYAVSLEAEEEGKKTGSLSVVSSALRRGNAGRQRAEAVAGGATDEITASSKPTAATTIKGTERAGSAARPFNLAQQATIVEALARLVEQKVTPDRALMIISRGRSGVVAEYAARARRMVRTGSGLTDALVKTGALTDGAAIALITAGEASGELSGALGSAARTLNGRLSAQRKLIGGLIYPAVLLTVSLASIALVLIGIIPEFRPLVVDRFDLVPPLGRLVFALSEFLTALWPLFLAALLVATVAAIVLLKRGLLGPALLGVGRRLPWLGQAVEDNRAMLLLRILGYLLDRRLPLDRALAILASTNADPDREEAIQSANKRVERGDALSDACEAEALLPPAAIELMRIGEETGTLPEMLLRAADDLEESAGHYMSRVLTMIEPALVVLVGCIIGVSLYALFTAITAVNATAF